MEAFYASTSPRLSGAADLDDDKPVARGIWSELEHERFLEAMKAYPLGPWRTIADHVGTRSIKQVQTHAQKYQQKVARRQRGLRKQKKRVARPEHRVDQAAAGFIVRMPVAGAPSSIPALKTESESPTTPASPSSPSLFGDLLRDAMTSPSTPMASSSSDEEEEIDLDELLRAIEPLPFSLERACDPFASHQLHESLQLFLTSV